MIPEHSIVVVLRDLTQSGKVIRKGVQGTVVYANEDGVYILEIGNDAVDVSEDDFGVIWTPTENQENRIS